MNLEMQGANGSSGFGGIEPINMALMMTEAPNVALTQVIIIPGSLQQTDYAGGVILRHVSAGLAAHENVSLRYVAGCPKATVNWQGVVS